MSEVILYWLKKLEREVMINDKICEDCAFEVEKSYMQICNKLKSKEKGE